MVDQSVLSSVRLNEPPVPILRDVAARLFPQLTHSVHDVALEQSGVPLDLGVGCATPRKQKLLIRLHEKMKDVEERWWIGSCIFPVQKGPSAIPPEHEVPGRELSMSGYGARIVLLKKTPRAWATSSDRCHRTSRGCHVTASSTRTPSSSANTVGALIGPG